MKEAVFSYEHAGVPKMALSASGPLYSEIIAMNKASWRGYDDDRASINLPADITYLKKSLALAKKYKNVSCVVVAGIGGSNLGTMAVCDAIFGKFHNLLPKRSSPKILFADTVDPDSMHSILRILSQTLEKRKKILLCFITKSGATTETVSNFEVLYRQLARFEKKPQDSIVAITDRGSNLWNLAQKLQFPTLEIPKKVGGRYSVFSAVGIFPLAVAGVDVAALLKGASSMRKRCLEKDISKNPAALCAIALYHHLNNGKNIHDTFLFANDLESVGKWYRQLMGESIGKEFDRQGKRVNVGMTPTVSIGSTDLHSMAQLYLGGPYDKFTTFITLKKFGHAITTPFMKEYGQLVEHIQRKDFEGIMAAIVTGVQKAYQKDNRPYAQIVLPDKSESSIGQLLQMKMMEMMYLGSLMNVNPFDQPNVESYKTETKKILASN
ncbi:MAG TPA: hypothetical protein VJB12_02820 [Candidatus Nanoarchaeia archaeon]|nr:hypothetical protein [Candidatus Nanoarchaeia archaeon]